MFKNNSNESYESDHTKRIIILCIIALILIIWTSMYVSANSDSENSREKSEESSGSNKGSTSWSMFRYDANHTGNTTAIGPTTNAILWTNSTDDKIEGSPTIVDGRVYIGSWDNYMYCFDENNGDQIWKFKTGHRITSTPAFYKGKIYFNSGECKSYCLYANNGTHIWDENIGSSSAHRAYSSPLIFNDLFYSSIFNNDEMFCRYASNGTLIWSSHVIPACSSVALANGLVYIGTASGQGNKVYAVYANNGTIKWEYAAGNEIESSPTIVNNKLYFGSGDKYFYCINAETGDFIWKYLTGDIIYSSPAYANDRVYFGSNDGKMYCLDSYGNFNWSFNAGAPIYSSPAIAGGKLYFGCNNKKVYCLYANNGTHIWDYTTEGAIYSSPAIVDDKLIIASQNGKIYCFGRADTSKPKVEITDPMNDSTNVSISKKITITYSELMNQTSVENAISTLPTITYTSSWDETTLILSLISNLDYDTTYYITIDSKVKDLSGNSMVEDYQFQFTTEEEPDTTPPLVESTYPTNNSKNISVSATITITFSEVMNLSSVEKSISSIPGIAYTHSWESRTFMLTFTSNLEYSTEYKITVGIGSKDIAGNSLQKVYSFLFLSEEEGDITPPAILLTNPDIKESDVLVNISISITFSEATNKTSVENALTITPLINIAFSWIGNSVNIFPAVDLDYLTNYTITIGNGSMDLANNSMTDDYTFYFWTVKQDIIPPMIDSTFPLNEDSDIGITTIISITFSESMNESSVEKALSIDPEIIYNIVWNEKSNIITLRPENKLYYKSIYNINVIIEAKDLAGNQLEIPFSFSFTTREEPDTTPPKILSTKPSNGETDVETNTMISITFSEAMNLASVDEALTINPSINYTHSWNGNIITIQTEKNLDYKTNITITVGTKAKDLAGNFLKEDFIFYFITEDEGDIIGPKIISTLPANGDFDVKVDTEISITFSEQMDHTSVEDAITTSPSIMYTSSWKGNIFQLQPNKNLSYMINYTITVKTQAMDIAGNRMTEKYRFSFITVNEPDIIPPTIYHEPIIESIENKKIEITATITDNKFVLNAILFYRKNSTIEYSKINMSSEGYEYSAIIPASDVTTSGIEYYIWTTDGFNDATQPSENVAENPYKITVKDENVEEDSRLIYFIPIVGIIVVGIIGYIIYSKKPPILKTP